MSSLKGDFFYKQDLSDTSNRSPFGKREVFSLSPSLSISLSLSGVVGWSEGAG